MIGPTGAVRVMIATNPFDFREGAEGLAALVRDTMKADPFSGAVYVFRVRRADRIKIIFWDGTGVCLFAKRLEDVAVIDVSMPGLNGLEVTEWVSRECPRTRLLVLTLHENAAYVQPMLKAGACGYLLKCSAADDLLRAVRAVAAGGLYLDPSIACHAVVETPTNGSGSDNPKEALSPRETEVLQLVAQGFSNEEIARRIDLSVKSVETYKARAGEKLGLCTRAEIIRYGAAHGWLDA